MCRFSVQADEGARLRAVVLPTPRVGAYRPTGPSRRRIIQFCLFLLYLFPAISGRIPCNKRIALAIVSPYRDTVYCSRFLRAFLFCRIRTRKDHSAYSNAVSFSSPSRTRMILTPDGSGREARCLVSSWHHQQQLIRLSRSRANSGKSSSGWIWCTSVAIRVHFFDEPNLHK